MHFEGGFPLQSCRRNKGQSSQRPASTSCSTTEGLRDLGHVLDLPAPVSSSLRLLFPFSPDGQLLLLLKSNSNVTSLDKSSSFLKQAKLLLGLFLSLPLKDQAADMVDCVLLEDKSRVYSPMHLPWFPKKGLNERLLLSPKEFSWMISESPRRSEILWSRSAQTQWYNICLPTPQP